MIEAVGEEHWPSYFQTLCDRLKPGGTAAIQAITINEHDFEGYRARSRFHPALHLPRRHAADQEGDGRAGRSASVSSSSRSTISAYSYARTLRLWRDGSSSAGTTSRRSASTNSSSRKWVYYLSYCEAGFDEGSIDVGIYQYRKPV